MSTLHWLVVPDRWVDDVTVWHPVDENPLDCVVDEIQYAEGLRTYFVHRDDSDSDVVEGRVRLEPGVYPIEPWSTTYHGPNGPEYDSGLRVVADPGDERPPKGGLEPHQLWVWLRGAPTPHFEVLGTGALLDE